jgi:hypothetical protein
MNKIIDTFKNYKIKHLEINNCENSLNTDVELLSSMKLLTYLDICLKFQEVIPIIGELSHLKTLVIYYFLKNGKSIDEMLLKLPQLEHLTLNFESSVDEIYPDLSLGLKSLKQLKSLSLPEYIIVNESNFTIAIRSLTKLQALRIDLSSDFLNLNALEAAFLLVQQRLQNFALDTEFTQKMALAFGKGFNGETLSNMDFGFLPVQVLTRSELNGANGAFSSTTNKIYIAIPNLLVQICTPFYFNLNSEFTRCFAYTTQVMNPILIKQLKNIYLKIRMRIFLCFGRMTMPL